jgi:hypothetical protein
MRGAPSRRIGSLCQSCVSAPVRTTIATTTTTARQPIARLTTLSPHGTRTSASLGRVSGTARWYASSSPAAAAQPGGELGSDNAVAKQQQQQLHAMPDPTQVAAQVEAKRTEFFAIEGIPTKDVSMAALKSCLRGASELQPLLKRPQAPQGKTGSASRLVSLNAERAGNVTRPDEALVEAVNRISYSAYTIVRHPNVELAPELLELYVQVQSLLGRPESLPAVLELYANKPRPVVKEGGEIVYVAVNPNTPSRAIEVPVAELALHTAIQARNLDASLGIVEASYRVPAFRRQKMIKHGTVPALGLSSLPFGIFGLSTAYAAYWQNTMDLTTATGIGFAGISGYFFVVGSMGLIAKFSNMDQMKRVTWTPGTPLRYRWLREEERAAYDRIALAWGFKEPWRWGEETGPEWEGFKEYLGYRQMLLDRVEFMQGMG